jgi:hypothetical protein
MSTTTEKRKFVFYATYGPTNRAEITLEIDKEDLSIAEALQVAAKELGVDPKAKTKVNGNADAKKVHAGDEVEYEKPQGRKG